MTSKEDRIVEAAWQLFYRHGYRKVSMLDIADAAQMSRPTLYAVFENKEAVLNALIKRQQAKNDQATNLKLSSFKNLRDQLKCLFEIWIVEPFASVIDSENAAELLANCSSYAPKAIEQIYESFEIHLISILQPQITKNHRISAEDIAYILRVATTNIKASSNNLPTLQRMVDGLIEMTIATIDFDATL